MGSGQIPEYPECMPQTFERTVVVNGVSKAYSMTGWRIGYVGGPASLVKGMNKIASQSTSNPTSIAQAAAVAALTGDQSYIHESTSVFKARHDFVYENLMKIDGINCLKGDGTFYSFPDMNGVIQAMDNIRNDIELS